MSDRAGSRVERKLATVVFADLVGSTAAASAVDPERVRVRMERFYDAMAAEIESVGGKVEKFAGDAVMAVFGVPAALEDHAERALHATLAMRGRLRELFADELMLRAGVNTGEVVVGAPREGSSFVSGDAVNVAARLEQAAEPGETLVGERTVSAVRGAFEFGEVHSVAARGKAGGIRCRRLVRALSLIRLRGLGFLQSAFVGREGELAELQECYRAATASRSPALVLVAGDAGVGKTRLVRELWAWLLAQESPPLLCSGRCLPYGQPAYYALGEVVKEHFGITEGVSAESVRVRLAGNEILGLALGLDMTGDMHPLRARDRFQDAWVDLLTGVTAERPAVVLLEDLHWAEEPLLDLLEHLLERVRGPLLLLTTARPEFLEAHRGFGGGRGGMVTLEPFEATVAHELVKRLLGADPPVSLSAVVTGAEGNPFFVEEVLASLVDQGLLKHNDGGWAMCALPEGFLVPDSVQAVIAARIDLLADAEKEALQVAAVVGRTFWSGPVYELCADRNPDLRQLEQRDFIRRTPRSSIEGEREYAFKHALTREVAYASIPKAKRAHLHAAVAEWVTRFPDRRDEYAPIIAHHYAEAARPDEADLAWVDRSEQLDEIRRHAVYWLQRAAELALGRYEIQEALDLLRQALQLEPRRAAESALWREIGRAHALNYDGEPFAAAMEHAIELAHDPVETAELYSDLARETVLRVGMWRSAPDPKQIETWIHHALELIPEAGRTRAKVLVARALWGGTSADADEAIAIANNTGDTDLRFSALSVRSSVAFREQDYEQAHYWSQHALGLAGTVSDPELVADPDLSAVWPALALCRFDEARRHAAHVHDLNLGLTPHHGVHAIAVPLEVEELLGQWDNVRALRTEAEAAVEANLNTPCVRNARSILLCALAEEIAGQHDAAAMLVERADQLRMEGHGLVQEGPRVRLELLRGDLDAVRRLLSQDDLVAERRTGYHLSRISIRLDALAALNDRQQVELEAPRYLRDGTYLEPFALRALGIVRNDHQLIKRATERFDGTGLEWHARQTTRLMPA